MGDRQQAIADRIAAVRDARRAAESLNVHPDLVADLAAMRREWETRDLPDEWDLSDYDVGVPSDPALQRPFTGGVMWDDEPAAPRG